MIRWLSIIVGIITFKIVQSQFDSRFTSVGSINKTAFQAGIIAFLISYAVFSIISRLFRSLNDAPAYGTQEYKTEVSTSPMTLDSYQNSTQKGTLSSETVTPRESTRRCNFCSERIEHDEFANHVKAHAGNRSASEVGIVPDDIPSNEPTQRCQICRELVVQHMLLAHLRAHKAEQEAQ
jgi:hypothetical protein